MTMTDPDPIAPQGEEPSNKLDMSDKALNSSPADSIPDATKDQPPHPEAEQLRAEFEELIALLAQDDGDGTRISIATLADYDQPIDQASVDNVMRGFKQATTETSADDDGLIFED